MPTSRFEDVASAVHSKVDGSRALVLVGLDGAVECHKAANADFDSSQIAEFVTLLRIACRTADDAAAGPLSEMSWRSDQSVVLMSRVSSDRFLLLFGTGEVQTGLARYTLGRAARRLAVDSGKDAPTRRSA
jgi:predicted regulator of Ras-like GTPase activity (Roadblock/LC7/MglB family)